jgi:polyisoprenoid-binding protein YceI
MKIRNLVSGIIILTGCAQLDAAPVSFDFKDPKGVNAVQFHLDSLLEPISGTASGVSGQVKYDPANPAATQGVITVSAKSLVVPNKLMNEHLLGTDWLAAEAHPEITFTLSELTDVRTKANDTTAVAKGMLTLKGVTKPISVPVKLSHLPDAYGKRVNQPGLKGDLLVIRGEFSIVRADFGIQPGKNEDKVSPEVKLTLGIVGGAVRS